MLSLSVLVATAGGWVALRYLNGRVTRVSLHFGAGYRRPPGARAGAENFMLVGSDSRSGGQFQGTGARTVTGERSDTIILVHLASDGTATLLSFPRDTWVTVPDYTDPKRVDHPAHQAKINSAISEGGPSLAVTTLETLTGIRVDHFLQVDFGGFEKMTSAVGGVNVCIRHSDVVESHPDGPGSGYGPATNIDDPVSGFRGHDGVNHIDGVQALLFVRQRHGLPGGDLDRIRRQQQFIAAVFRKALSAQTLLDPVRLAPFLSAATASLTTDTATGLTDLRVLASRLRGLTADRVRFATIPTYVPADDRSPAYHGQAVLRYDPAQLKTFLAGAVLSAGATRPAGPAPRPAPTSTPPELIVAPSSIAVPVLNGTATAGLATRAARDLTARGFLATAAPAGATAGPVGRSEVRYGPGRADSAATVTAAVPGAVLRPDPTLGQQGLQLIVGADYTGAVAVTVTPVAAGPLTAPPPLPRAAPTTTATSPDVTCTY